MLIMNVLTVNVQTKSHLRQPVEDLLVTYFKIADVQEAIDEFGMMLQPVGYYVDSHSKAQCHKSVIQTSSGKSYPAVSPATQHAPFPNSSDSSSLNNPQDVPTNTVVTAVLDGSVLVQHLEPYGYAAGPSGGIIMCHSDRYQS